MRRKNRQIKHHSITTLIQIILVTLFGITLGCGAYLGDYYHANEEALALISEYGSDTMVITEFKNDKIVFHPTRPDYGLIFYPGGKVQYESYVPLMYELAEHNIMCVLMHMPGNLAVLNINAADSIQEEHPEITHWYIGGHSLGGAMASTYLKDHTDEYDGLILMGAYSTTDFSQTDLSVLSLYGSNDQVLSMEKYEENRSFLPPNTIEYIIEGGCHAYYGSYGPQDGDGTPDISNEEQIQITTNAILDFIHQK